MKKTSIAIVGAGVMGQSIIKNLLRNRVVGRTNFLVVERNLEHAALLRRQYKISVTSDSRVSSGADFIILAVKPQDFSKLALSLGRLRPDQVFISIIAGITLGRLKKELGTTRVVRAMPNLAAKVGQAFTVWKRGFKPSAREKKFIDSILSSLGEAVAVADEDDINKATAISGSGPAYLYYFMESLSKAAQGLGFKDEHARQMVEQTIRGAWAVYEQTKAEPRLLRQQVTSKSGTTDAAIKSFQKNKFDSVIKKGLAAAYKRARELSR